MATTPTRTAGTASRWRVLAGVAMVVLGMVGGVVALAGGADDPPAVPSMGSVVAVGAAVPTPGPFLLGGVVDDAGTATEPSVDPVVEAAGATPPAPAPASPAPAAAPAPPATEAVPPVSPAVAPPPAPPVTDPEPGPTTGTLEIQVTPVGDGASLQVWVERADGVEVLGQHEVTGPIVLELAPGPYEVFIQFTGPPYGPDENGIALGGGQMLTRDQVEVVAGRTTTVACSVCVPV